MHLHDLLGMHDLDASHDAAERPLDLGGPADEQQRGVGLRGGEADSSGHRDGDAVIPAHAVNGDTDGHRANRRAARRLRRVLESVESGSRETTRTTAGTIRMLIGQAYSSFFV